jgi:hypothetical protein
MEITVFSRRTLDWLSTNLSNGMSREGLRAMGGLRHGHIFATGRPGAFPSTFKPVTNPLASLSLFWLTGRRKVDTASPAAPALSY